VNVCEPHSFRSATLLANVPTSFSNLGGGKMFKIPGTLCCLLSQIKCGNSVLVNFNVCTGKSTVFPR